MYALRFVLFFLAACFVAFPAHAEQELVVNSQAGNPLFYFDIYDAGDVYDDGPPPEASTWTLGSDHLFSLSDAANYWSVLLGDLPISQEPAKILLYTSDILNAMASSETFPGTKNTQLFEAAVNNRPGSGDEPDAVIEIGKLGADENDYYFGPVTVLPDNKDQAHLGVVLLHEIGHAMGITNNLNSNITSIEGIETQWAAHLYDSWGKPIRLGDDINTSGVFDPDDFNIDLDANGQGNIMFTGTNVKQVLKGAVLVHTPGGVGLAGYIPILGIEGGATVDMSHIELRNSLMSHQDYRNWGTFMEAELAALQDIGINIDRKRFFGYSIYNDGISTEVNAANFAWSQTGFNSTPWAVGLHIYGTDNTVAMNANALSSGFSGVGIRVDGWNNALTIAPGARIFANGEQGTGLMVAYGKEHEINLNGAVSADGPGGVGARFDFGSNILVMSVQNIQKGSWIHTNNGVHQGLPAELNGPLVENFNVSGQLSGSEAAIYISENAYVRNINFLQGADVRGDIISDWDPTAAAVALPGGEDGITELVYGLAGAAPGSYSLRHIGDIQGDSIDWGVAGGSVIWSGNAEVRNFEQKSGANLLVHANPNSITVNNDLIFEPGSTVGVHNGWQGYSAAQPGVQSILTLSDGTDNDSTVVQSAGGFSRGFYDYTYSGLNWSDPATLNVSIDSKVVNVERSGQMAVTAPFVVNMQNPTSRHLIDQQSLRFALRKAGVGRGGSGFGDIPNLENETEARALQRVAAAAGQQAPMGAEGRGMAWLTPSFNYSEKHKGQSFDISTPTLSMGLDYWLNDWAMVGMAVSTSFARFRSSPADINGDIITLMPYAGFLLPYEFELGVFASCGLGDIEQRRHVEGETYRSDYDSDSYTAGLALARPFELSNEFRLRPFVNYEFIRVETESYTENRGVYGLGVGASNTESHRLDAGAELEWYPTDDSFMAFSAWYAGLYGDRESASDVFFSLDPARAAIESKGYSLDEHSLGLGLDLGLHVTENTFLGGGYSFVGGDEHMSHQFNLRLEYSF